MWRNINLTLYYTILTAAHCIATEFDYDYNDEIFNIPIETNQYFPTFESTLEISLGLHNIQPQPTTTKMSVVKIKKVYLKNIMVIDLLGIFN